MLEWNEPKYDYKAADQVVPEIFNVLGKNEKHLKEITCEIDSLKKTGEITIINHIVLEEV